MILNKRSPRNTSSHKPKSNNLPSSIQPNLTRQQCSSHQTHSNHHQLYPKEEQKVLERLIDQKIQARFRQFFRQFKNFKQEVLTKLNAIQERLTSVQGRLTNLQIRVSNIEQNSKNSEKSERKQQSLNDNQGQSLLVSSNLSNSSLEWKSSILIKENTLIQSERDIKQQQESRINIQVSSQVYSQQKKSSQNEEVVIKESFSGSEIQLVKSEQYHIRNNFRTLMFIVNFLLKKQTKKLIQSKRKIIWFIKQIMNIRKISICKLYGLTIMKEMYSSIMEQKIVAIKDLKEIIQLIMLIES